MNETLLTAESTYTIVLQDIGKLRAPFSLGALPYATTSLLPVIDERTMEVHHGKHHQAYVDNLNKAIGKDPSNLIGLMVKASSLEAALRNNAGGHFNHTFFWHVLTGEHDKQQMPKRLESEIVGQFGSVEKFKEEFEKAGLAQFGSGWVWLIRDADGKLAITTTSNQDNPLMDLAPVKGRPILTVDLWEHAYYLKYENKRAEYLKSIWKVISWAQVDAFDREVTAH